MHKVWTPTQFIIYRLSFQGRPYTLAMVSIHLGTVDLRVDAIFTELGEKL